MSSGPFVNAIINRTGSIPNAAQGTIANRPATGNAPGDWYLALDEQILYEWRAISWVVALDGSGVGVTPAWQDVMGVGNTSNITAVLEDSFGDIVAEIGDVFAFGAGAFIVCNPGGYPFSGTTQALYGYILLSTSYPEDSIILEWYDSKNGDISATSLQHRINTARRRIYLPDKDGDVTLGKSGLYTAALTVGQTTISIPHGMWPAPVGPTAPANACINPTDATTRGVLAGGYYLTYTTSNIVIHLTVAVVGTPTANISWSAFV